MERMKLTSKLDEKERDSAAHTSLVEGVAVTASFSASLPTPTSDSSRPWGSCASSSSWHGGVQAGSESWEAVKHVNLCSLT